MKQGCLWACTDLTLKGKSQSTDLTYWGPGAWYPLAFPACPAVWPLGTARHLLLHKAGGPGGSPPVLGHSHPPRNEISKTSKKVSVRHRTLNCIAGSAGAKRTEMTEFHFHKYNLSMGSFHSSCYFPPTLPPHPLMPPTMILFLSIMFLT